MVRNTGLAISLLALLLNLAQADGSQATRVQAIFVANTDDARIGFNCGQDVRAFQHYFKSAFANRKESVVIHNLTGNRWNADRVLQYIKALKVRPTDTLVFYHSGHGRMSRQGSPASTYQLILNRSSRLPRHLVRRALDAHKAHATILITDCCSGYSFIAAPGAITARPNQTTCETLFLKTKGIVDITAAQDGRNAIAAHVGRTNTGAESAFTVALLALLTAPNHKFHGWKDFFPSLQTATSRYSGRKHTPRAFALPLQKIEVANRVRKPQPARPELVQLAGTSWVGSERLRGYGYLRFDFTTGGKVYMIDQKRQSKKVPGTWAIKDKQLVLSFFGGSCVYRGKLSGTTISGTASARNHANSFAWAVKKSSGTTIRKSFYPPTTPTRPTPKTTNPPRPKTIRLVGTTWRGRETLAGYGALTFRLEAGNRAVMIDAKNTSSGTWSHSGDTVSIRFGNCAYVGRVRNGTFSGTARFTRGSSRKSWSFGTRQVSR